MLPPVSLFWPYEHELRDASSCPAFPTVLLPVWFSAFLELPSRCWACGEVLCNFPCPLLPSAGDMWSLLFTLQFLALLATKMLLLALWTISQWIKSFVWGHNCALWPVPICDLSVLGPCLLLQLWSLEGSLLEVYLTFTKSESAI